MEKEQEGQGQFSEEVEGLQGFAEMAGECWCARWEHVRRSLDAVGCFQSLVLLAVMSVKVESALLVPMRRSNDQCILKSRGFSWKANQQVFLTLHALTIRKTNR